MIHRYSAHIKQAEKDESLSNTIHFEPQKSTRPISALVNEKQCDEVRLVGDSVPTEESKI